MGLSRRIRQHIAHDPPGERFTLRYERRHPRGLPTWLNRGELTAARRGVYCVRRR